MSRREMSRSPFPASSLVASGRGAEFGDYPGRHSDRAYASDILYASLALPPLQ